MNITFFYNDECGKCAELKPIVTEFNKHLGIKMVNTYEEDLMKIKMVNTYLKVLMMLKMY